MTTKAWAVGAFAYGYGEYGTFPLPPRAIVECALIESSNATVPALGPLIVEAGRTEGKRAKRYKGHKTLYSVHAAELAKVIEAILKRIDIAGVAKDIVALAAQNADSGATPVARRASVQAHVRQIIDAHATAEDLTALHAVNASGWAHATAYGTAEAESTPRRGGPPDSAKVAAGAAAALNLVSHDDAVAATAEWSVAQLDTVAMGVAVAASDGKALGDATRKVTSALVDSGRASKVYADQLHRTVGQAFVARVQADAPEAQFNWVNGGPNPCEACIQDALDSPYDADDLPDYPEHVGCMCDIEMASVPVPANV